MGLKIKNSKNIVTDGLIFNLDASDKLSYSGTGSTWTDRVNNKSGSMLNMGSSNFSSSNNGILNFDGAEEQVTYTSDSNLRLTTNMTFSYFFKRSNVGSGQTLMGRGPQQSTGFYWLMIHQAKPYFQYRGQSGYHAIQPSYTVNTGEWYSWDVVIESSTSIKMYINGENIHEDNSINEIQTAAFDDILRVGSYGSSGHTTWLFSGSIGSAMIYNKSLTSDEILQNYNATKGRFGL